MTYQVILTKPPIPNPYRPNYFPRTFRYLKDAQFLMQEVARYGGEATIVRDASVRRQA